jgi:hypothetical protein
MWKLAIWFLADELRFYRSCDQNGPSCTLPDDDNEMPLRAYLSFRTPSSVGFPSFMESPRRKCCSQLGWMPMWYVIFEDSRWLSIAYSGFWIVSVLLQVCDSVPYSRLHLRRRSYSSASLQIHRPIWCSGVGWHREGQACQWPWIHMDLCLICIRLQRLGFLHASPGNKPNHSHTADLSR